MSSTLNTPYGDISESADQVKNMENEDLEELPPAGGAMFAKTSSHNFPVKEGRAAVKKLTRVPRLGRTMSESDASYNTKLSGGQVEPKLLSKNSRKSRTAVGRGIPKKGGAGGKGVWGKPGSELFEQGTTDDTKDPNYDSDNQDQYAMEVMQPALLEEEIEPAVRPILQEYLEHGQCDEVLEMLADLNFGLNKHRVPELAISLAMERHDSQRELTSRLINALYTGGVVSPKETAQAFKELLNNLSDLILDTPDAPIVLGHFIARAMMDKCLPDTFISSYQEKDLSPAVKVALDKASILMKVNHTVPNGHVWGVGGGIHSVEQLKVKVVTLIKEYLSSGDINEATRCLQELDVPHFHHEFVYQAIVLAVEDSKERSLVMIVELLKTLTDSAVVTKDALVKGLKRIVDDMPEISVDVPAANILLERIESKLLVAGVINDSVVKELPPRSRKRFVSEGDGGRLKEHATH